MGRRTAIPVFVGICLFVAVLLVTHTIGPVVSSLIFAASLVVLGVASGGFRK